MLRIYSILFSLKQFKVLQNMHRPEFLTTSPEGDKKSHLVTKVKETPTLPILQTFLHDLPTQKLN